MSLTVDIDSERSRKRPRHNAPTATRTSKALTAEELAAKKRLAIARKSYGRGAAIDLKTTKDRKLKADLRALEDRYSLATLQAKDAEILHESAPGFLEPENELERTYRVTQSDIRSSVGLETAKSGFSLKLDPVLGPYRANYTRTGRHLLLTGAKGHVAAFDWRSGKLGCELQLNTSIRDATWLHNSGYFALAEQSGVHIYDGQGVELHHLTEHVNPLFLDFLPYHFLLVSAGQAGWLKYHDTSTGKIVAQMGTKVGAPTSLGQNPRNAVVHVGHQNGTVSLWAPTSQTPLAKMLCHRGPVRSLGVDRSGRYMVSTGQDMKMSVWDVRNFKELHSYALKKPATSVAVSDRGLVAVGWGTTVSVWRDMFKKAPEDQRKGAAVPYMNGFAGSGSRVESVSWCPFEDVLGVGHEGGFASAIIPGAGEANFDAMEINPYENVKQRQEAEVKQLLNKLQPEMIGLNPDFIGRLDTVSHETRMKERDLDRDARKEEQEKLEDLKNRGRGKNSSLRKYLRKKGGKNVVDEKRVRVEEMRREQQRKDKEKKEGKKIELGAALGRFARDGGG